MLPGKICSTGCPKIPERLIIFGNISDKTVKPGTNVLDIKIYFNTYSVIRYFIRETAYKESEAIFKCKHRLA